MSVGGHVMPNIHVDAGSAGTSFWQNYSSQNLSNEDERKIKDNLVSFFLLLNEWSIKENEK